MRIIVWIADHSVLFAALAAMVAIVLKFENKLPGRLKRTLFWADISMIVAALLLGLLKDTLDSKWKAEIERAEKIHERDLAAAKEELAAFKRQQQRSFTAEDRARFVRACSGVKGPLRVSWTHGSPEAATFAAEVRGLLEEAGFTATLGRAEPLSPIPVGIQLYCKASSPPQYLRTLLTGLNELGLKVAVINIEQEPPDLLIGLKP